MFKMIRNLLLAFLALVAILLIAAVVLATRIDLNDYKPQIVEQARTATGLNLKLDGDIGWSFFPSLAIKLENAEAHTAKTYASDTLFAKVATVDASVSLKPLLSRQVVVDKVLLDGIQLRLVTDSRGHSNWKDIESQAPSKDQESDANAEQDRQIKQGTSFLLNNLVLSDIKVNVIDQSVDTKQSLIIKNLSAQAVNIDGNAFPLDSKLIFDDGQQNSLALSLKSNVLLDTNNQRYELNDLNGQFDKSNFNGSAKVSLGKSTRVTSTLNVDKIDLNRYIDFESTEEDSAATADASTSTTDSEIQLDVLHSLNTNIAFSIGELQADNVTLSSVNVKVDIDNGRLNLSDLSAEVFGGKVQQSIQIDANKNPATWSASQKLSDIDIKQLIDNREIDVDFSGIASLNSTVNMRGNSTEALQRSLSGQTTFAINKGVYGDDNIERRICQAIALTRQQTLAAATSTSTQLNDIKAAIQWNNGVGTINSLSAGLPNATISGDGSIDINKKNLDIRLLANISGDIADTDPACAINESYRDIKWPIRCQGSADSSSCGVDNSRLDKIIANAAKAKAKEAVNKELDKQKDKLKDKLNEKLGDGLGDALRGLFK